MATQTANPVELSEAAGLPPATLRTPKNRLELDDPARPAPAAPRMERWQSGRMRRFAKSVTGVTWSAGSNPVLSAEKLLHLIARRRMTTHKPLPRQGFCFARAKSCESLRALAAPVFAALLQSEARFLQRVDRGENRLTRAARLLSPPPVRSPHRSPAGNA